MWPRSSQMRTMGLTATGTVNLIQKSQRSGSQNRIHSGLSYMSILLQIVFLRVPKPLNCIFSQGVPNPFLLEDSQAGFRWCQLITQHCPTPGAPLSFGGRTLEDTTVLGRGICESASFTDKFLGFFLKPGNGEET